MEYLITLCGSPASGKTTLSKKLAEAYNLIRYSFDERNCIYYKDLIQPVLESLNKGQHVIIDALHNRKSLRKLLLETIIDFNCKKILIYIDIPLEECIRRNAERLNPLPTFIVEDIYNSFEPPALDEGWDEIIYIKEDDCYGFNVKSN